MVPLFRINDTISNGYAYEIMSTIIYDGNGKK